MLTQERLKELFEYDSETGLLIRACRRGKAPKGTHSTAKDRDGYLVVGVDTKMYRAHRLAWLYMYGTWPCGEIDHINGVKDDNRIVNLRDVTRSENKQNSKIYKSNKCGTKGVWLHTQTKRWCTSIYHLGKNIHIGCFDSIEDAAKAYSETAAVLHKYNPSAKIK